MNYDRAFALESDGIRQSYAEFLAAHQGVYGATIEYEVRFDEWSWAEAGDRVAARLWITTRRPDEEAVEIEVVLIATYSGERILHHLELTWPDFTRVQALDSY